jgi:hypothetical protein
MRGGDGKYGRLLTEADLANIERYRGENGGDWRDAITVLDARGQLTFPGDEPLFLLRAKDVAAAATLRAYHSLAFQSGAEKAHLDAVVEECSRFREWHNGNPKRMKVPD